MELFSDQFPDDINELKSLLINYIEENAALKSLLADMQLQDGADTLNVQNEAQLTKIRLMESLQRIQQLESEISQRNQRIQDLEQLNEHLVKQQTSLENATQTQIFTELFDQAPDETANNGSNDRMLRIIAEISALQSVKRKYSRVKRELQEMQTAQVQLLSKLQEQQGKIQQKNDDDTIAYLEVQLEKAEQSIQQLKKEILIGKDEILQLKLQNSQLSQQLSKESSVDIDLQQRVRQSLSEENLRLRQEVDALKQNLSSISQHQGLKMNNNNVGQQNNIGVHEMIHGTEQNLNTKFKSTLSQEIHNEQRQFSSEAFKDVVQQLNISKIFNQQQETQKSTASSTYSMNQSKTHHSQIVNQEQQVHVSQKTSNNRCPIIPFSLDYSQQAALKKSAQKQNEDMVVSKIMQNSTSSHREKQDTKTSSINAKYEQKQNINEDNNNMLRQSQLISQLMENMEQAHRILYNEQPVAVSNLQEIDDQEQLKQKSKVQTSEEKNLNLSQLNKVQDLQDQKSKTFNNQSQIQQSVIKQQKQQNTNTYSTKNWQYSARFKELNARYEQLQRKIMNQ